MVNTEGHALMDDVNRERLARVSDQLFEAIAYGDAAGLPVEYLNAREIRDSEGYVSQLLAPNSHPFFADESEPGVWSDDTQLSLAVAHGLLEATGFDLDQQAYAHMWEYLDTPQVEWEGKRQPRGWGGSTYRSIERILANVSPAQSGESGFNERGERMGAGNAALIKLAPLVLWQAADLTGKAERYAQYDSLTRMTHDTDVATACTRVHGEVLRRLLARGSEDPAEFLDFVEAEALQAEKDLPEAGRDLSSLLGYLWGYRHMSPDTIIGETDGRGFYAPQTLAMAYGAYVYSDFHDLTFEQAVYTAVNLGGDTDSIASITATMILFSRGGQIERPADWDKLQQRGRLQEASKDLTRLLLKQIG